MIERFLTAETIQLQINARNRDEAVELAAGPLVGHGKIKPEYVAQIKQALVEFGPYMVILPGIALVHASPGENVIEECMSFASFAEPVVFGHRKNDPVRVVFTIASPCKEKHFDSLHSLSKLLDKPGFQEMLFTTCDLQEMLGQIQLEEN
jgi:PTS system ascorbate-specific IIA component